MPPPSPLPPRLQQRATHDVDEQAALLQGWQQDYLQLSPGRFEGRVRDLHLADLHLFVEDTSRRLLQRGARPAERLALGLPLSLGQGSVSFCGATDWQGPEREARCCSFSGAEGFEFMTPEGLSMAGLDLPLAALRPLADDDALAALADWSGRAGLRRVPAERLRALRQQLAGLLTLLEQHPEALADAAPQHRLRQTLLSNVLALLTPSEPEPGVPRSKAAHLVAQAQAFVRADPESPHTVATLCQALGVSRRTLQAAFQQVTGLAPSAFLRTVRLAGARRCLRQARSVAEAATQWGFWHLGLFAQDYRELYGERPSQTWRRHHGAPDLH